MAKKQAIEVEANVTEALPNGMFRVTLPNEHQVLAHVSGKIRMHFIRVLPGDRVLVVSFGSGAGSDAFQLCISDRLSACREGVPSTRDYVQRRTEIDYATYARYRGKLTLE